MSKKIPFDQCLSPEDKLIQALRAEIEALKQQVEQIEQETAEACAKFCKALADCDENTEPYRQGASWCEEAIRSGAWKEYK